MKKISLFNGDCEDLFGKIEDNSVDLIITDPPYGVEYSKGFDDSLEYVKNNVSFWLEQMYRVLKDGCHCYIFIPTKEIGLWLYEIEKVFNLNNVLSVRSHSSAVYCNNNFQFNCQLVAYCSKGKAKKFNEYDYFYTSQDWLNDKRNKNPKLYTYSYPAFISNVFANTNNDPLDDKLSLYTFKHPCAKNVELLNLFVGISSNKGDVVFDPFAGGGSSGVAATEMGRSFIGFEKNAEYFDYLKEKFGNFSAWHTDYKYEIA